MAENDIYNSESKYLSFKKTIDEFSKKPEHRSNINAIGGKSTFYCKNESNMKYFKVLFKHFEAKDISYVRRLRLLQTFKLILHATDRKLEDCDRPDIDNIVIYMHERYKSSKSKRDFLADIKHLWKIILPELDNKGRIDDTIFPYPVRHLSPKQDKSREKRRDDILTLEELKQLMDSFSNDPRMQAYLAIAFESLGRPQELLYTKIKDVELHDNYAKIWISEHGKEGTGFLQIIDSYPYLVRWYNKHPQKTNPKAFLFIQMLSPKRADQLRPHNINKLLREHMEEIAKRQQADKKQAKEILIKQVTCYSLKRSGVTFRRLRGDSDATIQHTARWTSTKQLKTYDHSEHEQTFNIELAKRGLIKNKELEHLQPTSKTCPFCGEINGLTDEICSKCLRPLDRAKIEEQERLKETEIKSVQQQMIDMQEQIKNISSALIETTKKKEHINKN